jgi:xylan 1,4-beta-xylosidase
MTDGARADWEERIGRRGVPGPEEHGGPAARLARPGGLRATSGRGHVTLDWDPVPGAAGYLVYRAAGEPYEPLDHGGGDVLAVPAGPYADTSGEPGRVRHYAVAAVADGASAGPLSDAVAAAPAAQGQAMVTIDVGGAVPGPRTDERRRGQAAARELGARELGTGELGARELGTGQLARPWEPMIGSEHLSCLLRRDRTGGRVIGTELREALRIVRDELGVRAVRAHGILDDDLGVYTESAGRTVHDFRGIDRVYDELMAIGLRPVVELSFMPRDLARDPDRTVFTYGAIISPPKDWDRWAALAGDLAAHLIQRYGRDEVVSRWAFEVWNEPNLEVFWSGTPEEYFRLYDVSARAIKEVDPGLRVGGPASAAAGWIWELLGHLEGSGAPLDFLSTHVYGNVPLDLRPVLGAFGRAGTPIWWTEWGTTPTHFHDVGDTVFAAAFLLRGMASAMGRIEALSHWVASDHFEELGPPPELFHGGFGLLSVGNLRKPRYWALALLARLGRTRLPAAVSGDGAGGLVEALAARHDDGRLGVLAWNITLDQGKISGDPLLDRQVRVRVSVPPGTAYAVRHYRIDAGHSNIVPTWERMRDGASWPSSEQWAELAELNTLDELSPPQQAIAGRDGVLEFAFDLPMPAVSYLELIPQPQSTDR